MLARTEGLLDVARHLAALLARAPTTARDVRALAPGGTPQRVGAVDGSNATLAESGSHLVGAWRASGILLEGGKPRGAPRTRTRVALFTEDDGLSSARAAAEREVALDLVEDLAEGDLLLLDGALHDADKLVARAAERGVDLVGVCKSTSLTIDGAPALAAAHTAARDAGATTWWCPVSTRGNVVVAIARLSRAEERPFRFDVAAHDANAARALAAVATLAAHPAYPGYPSPLAMAHHAATIQEDERRRLASSVQEAALRAGAREDAWRAAFADYHDELELGV